MSQLWLFYLQLQVLNFSELWRKLASACYTFKIVRYKFTILRNKVTIMRLKLAILTLFLKIGSISQNYNLKSHFFLQIVLAVLTISQNCEFISCHSYFVTRDCKLISFPFTFMHLANAFIQSDLQCIHVIHFHQYVFPGNRTHNLWHCWRNALPLSHTGTLISQL